ncbi:MAG: hypothetical protein V1792_10340 [Pseudomonadota bacterium]
MDLDKVLRSQASIPDDLSLGLPGTGTRKHQVTELINLITEPASAGGRGYLS